MKFDSGLGPTCMHPAQFKSCPKSRTLYQLCYPPKGWQKKPNKNAPQFLHNFSGYKHAKRLGHSSIWSTKTFQYEIREPRYKQNKIGYQISTFLILDNLAFCNLMSHTALLANLCSTEISLNLKTYPGCHL